MGWSTSGTRSAARIMTIMSSTAVYSICLSRSQITNVKNGGRIKMKPDNPETADGNTPGRRGTRDFGFYLSGQIVSGRADVYPVKGNCAGPGVYGDVSRIDVYARAS